MRLFESHSIDSCWLFFALCFKSRSGNEGSSQGCNKGQQSQITGKFFLPVICSAAKHAKRGHKVSDPKFRLWQIQGHSEAALHEKMEVQVWYN